MKTPSETNLEHSASARRCWLKGILFCLLLAACSAAEAASPEISSSIHAADGTASPSNVPQPASESQTRVLEGRVVDEQGAPMVGARVLVAFSGGMEAETDAMGRFRLTGLNADEEYELIVTAARSAVAPSIWGPWQELGNPCVGTNADKTFFSQSTCVLPVAGKPGAFIFMADRWRGGRYVWLPVNVEEGRVVLRWQDKWDLTCFDGSRSANTP
jgi:hypothetical protein